MIEWLIVIPMLLVVASLLPRGCWGPLARWSGYVVGGLLAVVILARWGSLGLVGVPSIGLTLYLARRYPWVVLAILGLVATGVTGVTLVELLGGVQ
jgi:hypothetical protein